MSDHLEWRLVVTKGRTLHNPMTHNVIWANQKIKSFVYHWLCAHAMLDIMGFLAFVWAFIIISGVLSIYVNCWCMWQGRFGLWRDTSYYTFQTNGEPEKELAAKCLRLMMQGRLPPIMPTTIKVWMSVVAFNFCGNLFILSSYDFGYYHFSWIHDF